MNEHNKYMLKAIELAKLGFGKVSPNPMVACVIVKNGEIVAEGYHEYFGGKHAEVNAIESFSGDSLEDCIVYLTLEPCTHHGKTPPCTNLLIEKNVKNIFIAMEDPNPIVKGKGVSQLRDKGVNVEVGLCKDEAMNLNKYFILNQTLKRPYIIAKIAMSLDGFIAEKNKNSKWISSVESRTDVHYLRSKVDAIITGSGTLKVDNPSLNVRLTDGMDPKRILFSTNLFVPFSGNLFSDNKENTIVVCSNNAVNIKRVNKLLEMGIKVIKVNENSHRMINLSDSLKKLFKEENIGICMLEAGSGMLSSFLSEELIDEIQVYYAPIILGSGISPFEKLSLHIDNKKHFSIIETKNIASDVKIVYQKNQNFSDKP